MNQSSNQGYVLTFEEDRLSDPNLQIPYPICRDFIRNYHQFGPRTIHAYFGTLDPEQLQTLEGRVNGFYEGNSLSVQELLLLYTLLYEMQTGMREIPVDGQLGWLIPIMSSLGFEKQKRAGVVQHYETHLRPVRFEIYYSDGRHQVIQP